MPAKSPQLLLLVLAVAAAGCYPLSHLGGRLHEGDPLLGPVDLSPAVCPRCGVEPAPRHGALCRGCLGGHGLLSPTEEMVEEPMVAPPARFHPLPTRPVFAARDAVVTGETAEALIIPAVPLRRPEMEPNRVEAGVESAPLPEEASPARRPIELLRDLDANEAEEPASSSSNPRGMETEAPAESLPPFLREEPAAARPGPQDQTAEAPVDGWRPRTTRLR